MPLPVDNILPELKRTLENSTRLVLLAPPGAGKTTRVPLAILDSPCLKNKKLIMLEPRRIAARAAARFMAESIGEAVGETVGYRMRQDNKIGPRTRIEVVTEGVLTRLIQNDPMLEQYGAVIFDEFHERSLNSDLGLTLCLDSQDGLREDLRILLMSATLDGATISAFLGNAPIIISEGRTYPVKTYHYPLKTNFMREPREFLREAALAIKKLVQQEHGSVLVFLPGASEINRVYKVLAEAQLSEDILLVPLLGKLSNTEQDQAIQAPPEGKRKVVLATAVAETSLTIEGIRVVIDCGLMRTARFEPNTGLSRLVTLNVSKASADQRRGRAGRVEAGVCYRLWPKDSHLIAHANPEIIEADLAPLLLELSMWGISEINSVQWLTPPPPAHLAQAKDLLFLLNAIDKEGKITTHGKAMNQWGVHPRLAHMILCADEIGIGKLGCEVASLLSERDIVRGTTRESDLRTRIEMLRSIDVETPRDKATLQRIKQNSGALAKQLKHRNGTNTSNNEDLSLLGVVLAFAYPDRIAKRRGQNESRYLLANGSGAKLHEHDPLLVEEFIVAAHLDGAREARIFLATSISKNQIVEFLHEQLIEQEIVAWSKKMQAVTTSRQTKLGNIVIEEELLPDANVELIQRALIDGIRSEGLPCLPWNENIVDLQNRIAYLNKLDNSWPDFSDLHLLHTLEDWLLPYLKNEKRISQLQQLDIYSILLSSLPWERQQQLDTLAPTHIVVPSGSRIKLDYSQSPPVLSVRLQEMFGLEDTPRITNNQTTVILHLLSPARRPVQVTQDLAGFWKSSYFDVKKDMKGRYPKHHWPDNPLEAQATTRTKKHTR